MPFELHRYIIGQKGSGIRKMMDEFEVCYSCLRHMEAQCAFYFASSPEFMKVHFIELLYKITCKIMQYWIMHRPTI